MSSRSEILRDALGRFLSSEAPGPLTQLWTPSLAAVGRIGEAALANSLLRDPLSAAGVVPNGYRAHSDPEGLWADPEWTLALVISPFKEVVVPTCQRLSPMAATSGVVDTVLRGTEETVGFNTNTFAAQAAIRLLVGDESPSRVLVAGTGASAKSVLWALSLLWHSPTVGIIGRAKERTARVAADFPGSEVVEDPVLFRPELVVHATAAGERDDAESLAFDLEDAFSPGVRFLDLTNRLSALQRSALSNGCVAMSGVFMQLATNLLRISLLVGEASTLTAIAQLPLES